jgi:signal transduction histidine kinase
MAGNSLFFGQIYIERVIAVGRAVMATFTVLVIMTRSTEPVGLAGLVSSLLAVYVVYTILLIYLLWKLPKVWRRLPFVTHVLDLIMLFALFLYFLGGSRSPFLLYFLFSVMCATLRWQWRGTVWTVVTGLVGFIGLEMYYFFESRNPWSFQLKELIVWGVFMIGVTIVLGCLGMYHERRRREVSMLAAWPRDIPLEARTLVRSVLEYTSDTFRTPRVLMVWDEEEDVRVHVASWFHSEFQWICEPRGTFQPLVAEPLIGTDFLCKDIRAPMPKVLHTSYAGFEQWRGSPLHSDLERRFAIKTVLSLKLSGEGLEGYLFLLDKKGLTSDDLTLGRIVAQEVQGRLNLFHLTQKAGQLAAAKARLYVSHDLHDGLLQSLSLMGMKLDTACRLLDKEPSKAKSPLMDIDRQLRDEQDGLRLFIRELKSLSIDMPHKQSTLITNIENLAKQIENQWGLRLTLTTTGLDLQAPEVMAHGVYYLVREALFNAARHAGASSIELKIHAQDQEIWITVADNGRGFSFRGHYDHATLMERKLGPEALKGRIISLGGTLSIESSEAGAKLQIVLPIPHSGG